MNKVKMIIDCPDSKEVSHFYFLQLRTLKLIKENENISSKPLNIIAAASKYGLLFVGIEGGLKVLKLEDILAIDDDKENKSIVENYSCIFVHSYTPVLLALNASEKVLALCAESCSGVSISFYDVLNFANEGVNWQPFVTSSLKSCTGFCDFIWNPTNEALYVYCLKDGSLHIEELIGTSTKIVASLSSANATSVCWSPKGKQLVVGRRDGFFVQYKPTLQEVKNVPPPPLEENSFSVANICWISNTSFAVLYVWENIPHFFMVSTVKDSPVSYTNFYDVCLGNASISDQKYLLHLEPQWGILVCASIDSVEIAVLGDMPNWVQWDLKEDGKALLPVKDGATHAIGTAVMYSATRKIIISESEFYPPMPVIFFVTNNGLLVSFHMINSNTDAASLVSPPVMLVFKKSSENNSSTPEAGRMVLKRSSSSSIQPSSSVFAVASAPSITNSTYMSGCIQPLSSSTFIEESKPSVSDQHVIQQNLRNQAVSTVPVFVINDKSSSIQSESPQKILNVQENRKPSQTLNRPWEGTTVSQASHEKSETEASSLPHVSDMRNEMLYNPDSSYMTALYTEIQCFTKELQDLKQLQSSLPHMNSEEDMADLKLFALNLNNFQKDSSEVMQSLNNDIFALKNVLLESFVMVEEVSSRLRCKNDHTYITMLKERALDPISAKRMQKIHQHYQYLCTQLQELNDKLDHDFINLLHMISKKQKSLRNIPSISSTEAIYKTIVNNQKIIHNLKKTVDVLSQRSEEKKIRDISRNSDWSGYHKRSIQEDLSKLADEFLKVKFTHQEEKEPPLTKKLSSESQNFLKKYLTNANVVTVRPTSVYSPSQSRLLSNALSASHSTISNLEEKQCEFSQSILPSAKTDDIPQVCSVSEIPKPKAPLKLLYAFEKSKNESTVTCTPIYEAITPPESFTIEPMNEQSCNGNMVGSNALKDKSSLLPGFTSPVTTMSKSDVSICKEKDTKLQGTSTSLFSSMTTSTKNSPSTPFSVGEQFLSQSSTVFSQVPPSSIFPQTLSYKSDPTKSAENESLKLFSTASNAPFSFALKNSKQNIVEQKVESDVTQKSFLVTKTVVTTSAVPASVQETKNPIISETPVFHQQDITVPPKSNSLLNLSLGQNTLFSAPGTKAPNFPLCTLLVNKKSLASTEVTSSAAELKSSTGFFFEKPATTSVANSNVSSSLKDEISTSFTTVGNEITYINSSSPDKVIVVDAKSSTSPKLFSVQTAADSKSGTLITSSVDISFNQLTLAPFQKTDMANVTSSESSTTVTFSDMPVLCQAITSESNALPQMPVITPVSISNAVVSSTNMISSTTTTTTTDHTTLSDVSPTCVVSQAENNVPAVSAFITESSTSTPICSLSGQNVAVTTSVSIASPTLDPTKSDTVTSTTEFGFKSQPLFNQTATGAVSFFGNSKPESGSVFGQAVVSQSGNFSQPQVSKSGFSATSGSFFSQNPSFEVSSTASNPDPNNPASAFSFGKSTFGQQTSGSFGLAKSLFGQSTTSFTQTASPSSFSFGQTTTTNTFGQGAFFSGLGGQPSEENANKNVFGTSSGIKPGTDTNLFGNSASTNFVTKSGSFSGGSFSSGRGSVAQSGFGSFQQNSPQKPGGFGSTSAFGGNPTFGSSPSFGSPPSFGSGNALLSVFAQQPQANFSNFASATTPTFGALASQTSTFGSPQPMGVGFGSQGTFSASPFTGSTFGAQSPGFGSPSSQSPSVSAFTQWRN